MYQLFRPSALSMDVIYTVGLFIFCRRKMYQGKVECKTYVAEAFRYPSTHYLQKYQLFKYYTSSHRTMCYSFYTLRRSMQRYWRRLSCIISGSPSTFAQWRWLPYSYAYFAQSIHNLFLSTLLVPRRLQQHMFSS